MNETEKALEEIRLKYIPDKREAAYYVESRDEGGITSIKGATNIPELKSEIEQKFKDSKYRTEIELLPSKELKDKLFGVVNLSVANIRTKPGESQELATQALLGTPVKVFQKMRGYYLIQTPDKYVAWVDDDGIQLMDEKEIMAWKTSNKVIFTEDYGFSYTEKDIDSRRVSDLTKGDIIKKLVVEGDFIKVEYPDKRIAYVKSSDVKDFKEWAAQQSPDEDDILSTAFKFIGIPYLWGGTSIKGMDCSGFTKTVYFNNGIILPRDASQQVNSGDQIDISSGLEKLQPGDLLFFGSRATDSTKERVTHVGIYIGDSEFIHSSGRVRINSLDKSRDNFSEYRFNSFLKAKRILGASNTYGLMNVKDLFNINGMQP